MKEDTVYKGGKGTTKKPPGGGKSLPQPQGSEPRRGDKPESGSSRKSVKGMQEAPQTVKTGRKDNSGPITTSPTLGDRPGEVLKQEPIQGQEGPGGAAERPGESGPPPPSSGPVAGNPEPGSGPGESDKESSAGRAPVQQGLGVTGPFLPPKEESRATKRPSGKRKATAQGNLSLDSGETLKIPGGGK